MEWIAYVKAAAYGVVEGITEWLPVSSTGHMILLDQVLKLEVSAAFWEVFLVVIQLGAILAVAVLYGDRLIPFTFSGGIKPDREKWAMWGKIVVASIPAGVVGVLWHDELEERFYHPLTVAVMLILFGVLFLVVEAKNKKRSPGVNSVGEITVCQALVVGVFQLIAAAFPGTSRSGATIIGGLMLGISRTAAAEFTFFLAIPAMVGGSALKLLNFGGSFAPGELSVLLIGMAFAFGVSVLAIRFLLGYIRRHDFRVFGWYRIGLGLLVLARWFLAG